MKHATHRFPVIVLACWCIAFLLPGALAATRPARAAAPKPADRFVRTKERIDTMLKSRLSPDPLPANPANPFQLPPGMAVADQPDLTAGPKADPANPTTPASTETLPPGSDEEALARYAASLKITGSVKLNGQLHLIVNQSPYKEGDLILLNFSTTTVYLQVIRIGANELTLGLNQAVQTIKFKF